MVYEYETRLSLTVFDMSSKINEMQKKLQRSVNKIKLLQGAHELLSGAAAADMIILNSVSLKALQNPGNLFCLKLH